MVFTPRNGPEYAWANTMDALKNRVVPDICVYYLITWIQLAGIDEIRENPLDFTKFATQINDWLFKWITVSRTRAELDAFAKLECRCSATQRRDPVHDNGVQSHQEGHYKDDSPQWMLMYFCFKGPHVYHRVIQESWAPKQRDLEERMNMVRRRTLWPYSIRALLPHGPRNTLEGVLQWFQIELHARQRIFLYHALDVFLAFCRPVTLPCIITSRLFFQQAVVASVRDHEAEHLMRMLNTNHRPEDDFDSDYNALTRVTMLVKFLSDLLFWHGNETERSIFNHMDPSLLIEIYATIARVLKEYPLVVCRMASPFQRTCLIEAAQMIPSDIAKLIHHFIEDCSLERAVLHPTALVHKFFRAELMGLVWSTRGPTGAASGAVSFSPWGTSRSPRNVVHPLVHPTMD
jgi:hypothetical protein